MAVAQDSNEQTKNTIKLNVFTETHKRKRTIMMETKSKAFSFNLWNYAKCYIMRKGKRAMCTMNLILYIFIEKKKELEFGKKTNAYIEHDKKKHTHTQQRTCKSSEKWND